MNNNITMDVRAYPVDEPKGATLAFASVVFKMDGEDLAAIRGIRVIDSKKGMLVSMPQSKDKDGSYHDIAFPLSGELRNKLTVAVLDESSRQADLDPAQRGYPKPEQNTESSLNVADIKLGVNVFPIADPKGSTLAFASVALADVAVIRGIRVVDGPEGTFMAMPQSKDKEGNYHDIAFPLSPGLRTGMTNAVLAKYNEASRSADRSLASKLREGAARAAQHTAPAPAAAKSRSAGTLE
jgi:stage V sporulation protein G